jgi:hypothetical protein
MARGWCVRAGCVWGYVTPQELDVIARSEGVSRATRLEHALGVMLAEHERREARSPDVRRMREQRSKQGRFPRAGGALEDDASKKAGRLHGAGAPMPDGSRIAALASGGWRRTGTMGARESQCRASR